jgi:hypothetical protein
VLRENILILTEVVCVQIVLQENTSVILVVIILIVVLVVQLESSQLMKVHQTMQHVLNVQQVNIQT